ncbi:MAG: ABC transporter substrate-binding protein, partial [Candidatus Aenigmatarchaeota archaeon]
MESVSPSSAPGMAWEQNCSSTVTNFRHGGGANKADRLSSIKIGQETDATRRFNMKMKTTLAVVAVAVLVISFGIACLSQEAKPIRISLPFLPGVNFMPFYVAAQQGFFEDEGFPEIEFEHIPDGYAPILKVASGEADFGFASITAVLHARAQGLPVVSIYQPERHNMFSIIVLAGSDIEGLEDMEGNKIAISGFNSPPHIAAMAMLWQAGVEFDEETFVAVGGS